MKRLIASDLHGSLAFCRQLLEIYRQEAAQQLVLLGDLVYSGSYDPRYEYDPYGVIQLLNPLAQEIVWVEGNCDHGVQKLGAQFPMHPSYVMVDWEGRQVFLTHGHRYSPYNPPPMGTARFCCLATPTFPLGGGSATFSAPTPARSPCPGVARQTAACCMRTAYSVG